MRLVIICVAMLLTLAAAPAASAATPAPPSMSWLTDVRTGRHATFDRAVLDLTGGRPEFFIRVVDQLISDGSGLPVDLTGTHFLEVRLAPAAAHDYDGRSTYTGPWRFGTPDLTNVAGFAITGDFEGNLTVGLGAHHESWHRVFLLQAPTRLVIDVGQ